ncbi:hypothetical protein E1258_27630 [Micromonospora sp. KC207]|uniref:hypothetical protein n=1 Tax=Micromonospora sp. KC207 TaxID=2530377 RepID=UPI0010472CB2|nr:hypothetical protein [Micromonospora sp. KC207]TDC48847.1 hypothetical protein E1258_27630 [Micromonospora sp. KC207]
MNRTERVQEVLRLEGLADAAKKRAAEHRAALDADARAELEREGTAPSWRLPDIGTVALAVSKEAPVVADIEALTKWCLARYPGEVETVHQIRASFQTALLGRVVCDGDVVVDPGTGEVVPGMAVRLGGMPQSLSIRPSRDARAVYAAAGAQMLDGLLLLAGEVPGHLDPADVPGGDR